MAPVSERLASAPINTNATTTTTATTTNNNNNNNTIEDTRGLNGRDSKAMIKDDDELAMGAANSHIDADHLHSHSSDASQFKVVAEDLPHHEASSAATSEDEKDEDEGDGEDDDNEDDNEDEGDGSTIAPEDAALGGDSVVCRWKDCGQVLPSLSSLVMHLSDDHIGWKKTSYTCEWQGCSRRPIAQTTRFALISHMRSHTKHKPYDCPVPECDKSFSRSDAMAKHLRCQHGDVPERFTGRRSRGRYTMKNPTASSTLLDSVSRKRRHDDKYDSDQSRTTLGRRMYGRRGRRTQQQQQQEVSDESGEDSDVAHETGQSLRERYGILKAKYRYISNERYSLECEYADTKKKLRRLQIEREVMLDALAVQTADLPDNLDAIEDSDEEE